MIYLPFDPKNNEVYENKCLTTNDILTAVWKYSDLFADKTAAGFGKWCTNKKINFISSAAKRKDSGNQTKRTRSLYMVKEKFIGYARKSQGEIDDENRLRLIQLMCQRLRERSLVEKVFVSVCSNVSYPISERDTKEKENKETIESLDVDGDTQAMLQYISTNNKICLVVLDYAGLTTDPSDLKIFVETNKNIEKIIVDNLPQNNGIETFERKQILENPSVLDVFKCRTSIRQRSK